MTLQEKLKDLKEPLKKEDVECRVGTVSAKSFSVLLYKTARVDAERLDNVFGVNWQRKHYVDARQNVVCAVSIYNTENGVWITREDVGSESFSDKQKGAYSDSFKRAGFAWGIGRELYQAPFIYISCETLEKTDNGKKSYEIAKKDDKGVIIADKFYANNLKVTQYEFFNGKFNIQIQDKTNKVVFSIREFQPEGLAKDSEVYLTLKSKIEACKDEGCLEMLKSELSEIKPKLSQTEIGELATIFKNKQKEFIK